MEAASQIDNPLVRNFFNIGRTQTQREATLNDNEEDKEEEDLVKSEKEQNEIANDLSAISTIDDS